MVKFNFLIPFLFFNIFAYGNVVTDPLELQNIIVNGIQNAPFIFEGEVISAQSYWNEDENYIYTANTIRVINVWKNENNEITYLNENQLVEVITHGGSVDDVSLSISHNIELHPGQKGMFLCDYANVYGNPNSNISSNFQFEFFDGLYIDYDNNQLGVTASFGSIQFECIEELYELVSPSYISECMGIYGDGYGLKDRFDVTFSQQQSNYQISMNAAASGKIKYSFENARSDMYQGKPRFIFDVMAETNYNGVHLTGAYVALEFNENVFGQDPVLNSKVKLHKGAYLMGILNGEQRYNPVGARDLPLNTTGYEAMALAVDFNTKVYEPREMPQNTPVHLFMVFIEIADCQEMPDMSFTDIQDMLAYTSYVSLTPPGYPNKWSGLTNFANIDATDAMNPEICDTKILGIHTDNGYVTAGGADVIGSMAFPVITNKDYVTIHGEYFGSVKGDIMMQDTDTIQWLKLDRNVDIESWTDDKIVFTVPSTLPINYAVTSQLKVPGSGKIKVLTKASLTSIPHEVVSDNELKVISSRRNISRNVTPTPYKAKMFLGGPDLVSDRHQIKNQSGYLFFLDPDLIALNNNVQECVQEAMDGWICATNVRFGLSQVNLPSFPFYNDQVRDNVSTITKAIPLSSTGSKVLAFTKIWNHQCTDNTSLLPVEYCTEIDIVFTDLPKYINSYWFDYTRLVNQPAHKYDFYSIILHEFGHALLLNHVNEKESIMRAGTLTAGHDFNHWHRKINLSNGEINAGEEIVDESSHINYANCQGGAPFDPMVPLILSNCNVPTSADKIYTSAEEVKVLVSPNPFEKDLSINFELHNSALVKYEIFTIDGKKMYESKELFLKSGVHELNWNSTGYHKGVYLMKLQLDEEHKTIKLLKL